jgi:undecaprenyl-diphosphatase
MWLFLFTHIMGVACLNFDILALIKYIFLGVVQGITEVLPVSSSGHVELIKHLLNLDVEGEVLFLILLNTGSLATFLIIYWRKLFTLIKSFVIYIFKPSKRYENYDNTVYLLKVLIACIPAGIAGIIIKPILENFMGDYGVLLAGVGLLVTATVIYWISTIRLSRKNTDISWTDTIFIGLAQAVAIFPGISRSGMTTSAALKRGVGIKSALDFSFLMYIFISLAATFLLAFDLSESTGVMENIQYLYYFFAFIFTMFATYIAYRLIFNIFRTGKLRYFSYYCFAAGILSVLLYVVQI